ncbi:hypothetical protein BGX33_004606 [Mortierella sp. NVP41]|nr:hypothetical protein BGX33_004606 [Mortierella sp. NVP41]
MDNKLQEKFALVQQMKRDKELKEASRVKANRSVDIFALAGVNIPTASSGQPPLSRQDSRNGPPGKRPRVQRTITSPPGPLSPARTCPSSTHSVVTSPGRDSEETSSTNGTTTTSASGAGVAAAVSGTEKKLKRSSMAVRHAASQIHVHGEKGDSAEKKDNSSYIGRGRNPSVSSMASPPYTSTPSHPTSDTRSATATPPTPIPSPRNDPSTHPDNSRERQRPVDIQANGRRWSGSTDGREDVVRTGNSQPPRPIRHQSPDALPGYDSNTRTHPLNDPSSSQEGRKRRMDGHGGFGRHPADYDNHQLRYRSNSRSRSRSPGKQDYFRSRSRSVSPYRDQDPSYYKRRDSARDFEQDYHPPYDPRSLVGRYQELSPHLTKVRVEGFAASTSLMALQTAFGPFGEIEETSLKEGKDYALVTYARPEAAQRALEMMNGTTLEGATIRVYREESPMYYQRGSRSEAGTMSPLPTRDGTRRPSLATSTSSASSQGLMTPDATTRAVHQLPPRPRSPKLPPKPVGPAAYPPVGADPRAAVAQARGRGRQLLSYGDL